MCVMGGGWSAKELGIALNYRCHEPNSRYRLKVCGAAQRALQWTVECGQKCPNVNSGYAYGLVDEVSRDKGTMPLLKG